MFYFRQSQWLWDLSLGSSASLVLGFRVGIPTGHECLSFVIVVCCRLEVSVTGRSVVQSGSTECGVSECDLDTTTRKPRPTRAVDP